MTHMERPGDAAIDHSALWDRIEESEQKTANLLKWIASSLVGILTAWALYSANNANAEADKATIVATTLTELRESQKALTWQVSQISVFIKELEAAHRKDLEEHSHNLGAHHPPPQVKGGRYD